ncbi:MAG: tail fiber assembly protein [Citrobacter sp.]|uniref:tail fiber assembly protein n=1 Tax=Citrobacter braakii TaxID=57706 RepID=UPI001903068F|nr:tail fiber assembly protein [Citrobacter braakii]MDU1186215.1 tail fiber assembly protein [Citrobacter sp.]MBJ8952879.1 tail fiber assembly protein [Citrobacter braakii]MBR7613105.1 tail fiber assembly protein [Citrobacter braakii]MDL4471086.1 tail fiber assembly protein [Citrobacter braakii]MDL4502815.1 tail fiber assembly protein [Citrobacter braakii]
MNYIYSATTNLFYPLSLRVAYEKSGDWPDDYIVVKDEIFNEFTAWVDSKIRIAGKDGLPEWSLTPKHTSEQLIELAEQQKIMLRALADSEIAWRQGALIEGIASDKEIADLSEWNKYRVFLMRIDTKKAPDIEWPKTPT